MSSHGKTKKMAKKSLHTKLDVLAVVYLIDYISEEYFKNTSVIGKDEYVEITTLIENQLSIEKSLNDKTIERMFSIRKKPHATSYSTFDIIIQWCFDGEYNNYFEFLDAKNHVIINANLVEEEEVGNIVNILNGEKSIVPKNVKLNLDNIPISFTLGKGFTEKLIRDVSIVTGNLLVERIKDSPKEFGIFSKPSINERIILKETRRQSNIDKIIIKAIEFSRQKETSSSPVDPDWIVGFFNLAQDCSNENMQYLWAKLLASEIDQPSSISRRTLSIIKLLEPKEAQIFTKLCNCIWNLKDTTDFKENILIKDMYMDEEYSDETWNFDSMFIPHLEAIGLVRDSFIDMSYGRVYKLDFFGKKHEIHSSKKLAQLDITTLTKAGKEVFNIIKPEPNFKYYKFTMEYFKKVAVLKE